MLVKDVMPQDAMQMLKNGDAMLIDVRTEGEWERDGVVRIQDKVIFLSLFTGPQMSPNPNFIDDLQILELPASTKLLFICKHGGRSASAASIVAQLGYGCYNVAGGFEAWKIHCLPRTQVRGSQECT